MRLAYMPHLFTC